MSFDAIRAQLAMAYGWTPRQTGREVTLRQLRALLRSWAETPPLAALAAAVARAFKMLPNLAEADWEPVGGPQGASSEPNTLGGHGPVYTREETLAHFAAAGFGTS